MNDALIKYLKDNGHKHIQLRAMEIVKETEFKKITDIKIRD